MSRLGAVQRHCFEGADPDFAQHRATRCTQACGSRASVQDRKLSDHHPWSSGAEYLLIVAGQAAHHRKLTLRDHKQTITDRTLARHLLAGFDYARATRVEKALAIASREHVQEIATHVEKAFVAHLPFRQIAGDMLLALDTDIRAVQRLRRTWSEAYTQCSGSISLTAAVQRS